MAVKPVRILGIDTSLRSTGVGIIETCGTDLHAIAYGSIRNKPQVPHSECLRHIFASLSELIEQHHPDCAAIEGFFLRRMPKRRWCSVKHVDAQFLRVPLKP